MPDQPLQPFSPPDFFPSYLSFLSAHGLSGGVFVEWFLFIVFGFWAIYTLVAIYHWFKYSNASWVMFPAVAAHLCISFALIAYALTGSAYFLATYLP